MLTLISTILPTTHNFSTTTPTPSTGLNKENWLIGCMVLDVLVITTNFLEQFLIIRSWKHLDRIDHLLLSLSVSDVIFGLATLTIDSWYLSRHLNSLIEVNNNKSKSCFSLNIHQDESFNIHYLDRYARGHS